MTIALIALSGALVAALVTVIGRSSRGADRREQKLHDLIRDERAHHQAVLDRVMYASGKPWEEPPITAVAPSVAPRTTDSAIFEDPTPGAFYPGYEDESDVAPYFGGPRGIVESMLSHANGNEGI